jgi:hypothetical protein
MIGNLIRLTLLAYAWSLVIPAISGATECEVTLGFTDQSVEASGVLVDIGYPATGGFVGTGGAVSCHSNVPGGLATFNNVTEDGVLTAALIRIDSFSGANLLSCAWTGDAVSATDFDVATLDATDSKLSTIEPFPTIAVTDVTCDGVSTTDDGNAEEPPASEGGCYLVVSAESSTAIGGLMFDVHYRGAGVEVAGSGDDADCYTLAAGSLGAYNDKEHEGKLTAAVVSLEGFAGYNEVVECYVDAYGEPSVADLDILILDAVDPSGVEIVPVPELDIRFTGCTWDDEVSEGPYRDREIPEEPATPECNGGTYDVTFGVDVAAELGSLQFAVSYAASEGGFEGSADNVSCQVVAEGNGHFASFNDQDSRARLLAGVVSIGGVETPDDVVRCRFESGGLMMPTEADFSVVVSDASTPALAAVTPLPDVVVTSIKPASDNECWAGCGNGVVDSDEECDDGNDSNTDACTNDCTDNVCGDGYVLAGTEECDQGASNSDSAANACRTNCSFSICGDGVIDAGEACDDGNENNTDSCLVGCVEAICGDAHVQAGVEDCDSGALNNDADPESCRTDCTWPLTCGDVDGNGSVTATDSRRVLESAIGLSAHCADKLCDVDGNARVTASDAQLVLGYAVGVDIELQCMLPVIISLESEQSIGALQFTIDYAETGSTFMGDGADVYCVNLMDESGGFVSFNNMVDTLQLKVGIMSNSSIDGPIDLLACSFYPTGAEISADAFQVEVTDAADSATNPIELESIEIAVRFE